MGIDTCLSEDGLRVQDASHHLLAVGVKKDDNLIPVVQNRDGYRFEMTRKGQFLVVIDNHTYRDVFAVTWLSATGSEKPMICGGVTVPKGKSVIVAGWVDANGQMIHPFNAGILLDTHGHLTAAVCEHYLHVAFFISEAEYREAPDQPREEIKLEILPKR